MEVQNQGLNWDITKSPHLDFFACYSFVIVDFLARHFLEIVDFFEDRDGLFGLFNLFNMKIHTIFLKNRSHIFKKNTLRMHQNAPNWM